jgi:S-adenosylmethionine-diacylglycerol 3-amino-3-carboxypropyl transferase
VLNSALWGKGRLGKAGDQPQIIFAQVREDAAIELDLLDTRPPGETVFCIASGGCTALSLLLARPTRLQIVDVNPAQMHLVETKIAALQHLPYAKLMRALLTDAHPYYESLRAHLSPAAQQFWDENASLLALGLNQCGVIEQRLKQIMRLLPLVQGQRHIRRLFAARDLETQHHVYRSLWDHSRWALAFELVLSKPVLGVVYGSDFVRAIPPHFAKSMKCRMDEAFLEYPLWENGYLWQTFRGIYPRGEAGLPLYLQRENHKAVLEGLPHTELACADAALWLEAQEPNSIGFFAISNILEITSPEYAQRLLRAVGRAAKPGACICLRSIFPFNDSLLEQAALEAKQREATCGEKYRFESMPSEALEAKDRSFFCKNIRVLQVIKSR